jgi:hypothetical protein
MDILSFNHTFTGLETILMVTGKNYDVRIAFCRESKELS